MSLCCCIRLVSFYQAYLKAKGQREGWSRYSQFQSCSQEHTRLPFHHFFILFSGAVSVITFVCQTTTVSISAWLYPVKYVILT